MSANTVTTKVAEEKHMETRGHPKKKDHSDKLSSDQPIVGAPYKIDDKSTGKRGNIMARA